MCDRHKPLDAVGIAGEVGKTAFAPSRAERMKQAAEELLSSFDLLLGCIENDCTGKPYLKTVKRKVQNVRKELRNIPIPEKMK
jgi:hypothetical protein